MTQTEYLQKSPSKTISHGEGHVFESHGSIDMEGAMGIFKKYFGIFSNFSSKKSS